MRERGHGITWIICAIASSTMMIYTSVNTWARAHWPQELLIQAMEKVAKSTRMYLYSPRLGRREKSQKYHGITENIRNEPVKDVSRDQPLDCLLVCNTFLMPLRDIISHDPPPGTLA